MAHINPWLGPYTYDMFRHDLGVMDRRKHSTIRSGQARIQHA